MTAPAAAVDTIAAVATAPGTGGVGIVRVSGPRAASIARAVLGDLPTPRRAAYRRFAGGDGAPIDEGLALFFPAPGSFTGEDVLELHAHGGPVVLDLLLARVAALGARAARPGEFSERAFLNGKLDLAQAEAVADLIEAGSAAAARAALRSLEGALSRRVRAVDAELVALRAELEAALDFPDEEVDRVEPADGARRLAGLGDALDALAAEAGQGRLLREGMTVVIAGRPNAGKSSLLNALAGRESAIVTHLPGTTRDVLREHLDLGGLPLHVIDTAGLRESDDPVEQEGVRRAWAEIERADRLLLVIDDTTDEESRLGDILARLPDGMAQTRVLNKCDLSGRPAGRVADRSHDSFAISALTGAGLDALTDHLQDCMGYRPAGEGAFMARRRHLQALADARAAVGRAGRCLDEGAGAELVAEELRQAHRRLGEITGEFTTEDLLGEIFARFCIGK